jgi:hypothetical protein
MAKSVKRELPEVEFHSDAWKRFERAIAWRQKRHPSIGCQRRKLQLKPN